MMMLNPKTRYRQAAALGASPVGLIILLYDQAIQDLRRALMAIEENNIERRIHEINHALSVIGHLEGTLVLNAGDGVVHNLRQFYSKVRNSLMAAAQHASKEMLLQQIRDLLTVREAWTAVEEAEAARRVPGMPN